MSINRDLTKNGATKKMTDKLKNHAVVFMLDREDRSKLRSLARAEGLSDAAYVRQILLTHWEREEAHREAREDRMRMIEGL